MRQTAPRRRIDWLYWLCVALFVATLLMVMTYGATHAHGGQVLTVSSSRQPIRRLRKETRITVLKPVRAHGRARAGYPFLRTTANVTRIGVNLSGLINPIGWFF